MKILLLIVLVAKQYIFGFEGDSLTDSGGVYYPMLAAGYSASQVPGYAGSFSQSSAFWPFYNGSDLCINRSFGGSRLVTGAATRTGDGTTAGNFPGNLTLRAPTWIDQLIPSAINPPLSKWDDARPIQKRILSLMIGTNPDVDSATTHTANMTTYLNARASAGWDGFIVWTLVSRSDRILADFEVYRQGINTILRGATWQNGINKPVVIADVGGDSVIGAPGASDNTTLFQDKVHPTVPVGANYFVPYLTSAMAAIKAKV